MVGESNLLKYDGLIILGELVLIEGWLFEIRRSLRRGVFAFAIL